MNISSQSAMTLATFLKILFTQFCCWFQLWFAKFERFRSNEKIIPKSVNYHFTRKCNYECGFCFHTAKSSFVLPSEEAIKGLNMLKNAGGEPFTQENGNYVGALVKYCKVNLHIRSVTIVSNGSLVGKHWFKHYGEYLDILAISCDSFNEETNQQIGRGSGRNHVKKLYKIRDWCKEYNVAFKINTVVNTFNKDENMAVPIEDLNPVRWKVFQCLLLEGENAGQEALRNAEPFYITDQEFEQFVLRHNNVKCLVPESNIRMRFLNCQENKKIPSKSILDVGVDAALNHSGFDKLMFLERGGVYKWNKEELLNRNKDLDW